MDLIQNNLVDNNKVGSNDNSAPVGASYQSYGSSFGLIESNNNVKPAYSY